MRSLWLFYVRWINWAESLADPIKDVCGRKFTDMCAFPGGGILSGSGSGCGRCFIACPYRYCFVFIFSIPARISISYRVRRLRNQVRLFPEWRSVDSCAATGPGFRAAGKWCWDSDDTGRSVVYQPQNVSYADLVLQYTDGSPLLWIPHGIGRRYAGGWLNSESESAFSREFYGQRKTVF